MRRFFLWMADFTFRDFVHLLEEGKETSEVHNLALIRNGRLEFTEPEFPEVDLDRLPLPARHLTDKYRGKYCDLTRNRTAQVMSSRGCPYRCTFCSCWKVMNGKYYTRSPESIGDELAEPLVETRLKTN